MNKSFSKKKLATAGLAGFAALALICAGAYALTPSGVTVYASTEETEDTLRVFVGDIANAPENYAQQRTAYLDTLTKKRSGSPVEAIIGLNDYYTVEDITTLAEDYDIVINRAYMWPKGETGRLSLYVEDGDIESSIELYKQQVEENNSCKDPAFAADYQRFLDGEYEVFALTVTASAGALEALNADADCINYVDVMYNAEAETYAARAGKVVSYIELPTKPDGAL